MAGLVERFPGLAKVDLRRDVPASVAVFFVAVPLCLGIAHASGAPLLSGLVAGIVGGLLVGFLSPSQLSVSGPAAGLTALVLTAKESLGSFQAVVTAVVLAGALQLALGVAKAGFLASFFPTAVVRGMLAGIGVILVLKQLPHLVGYDVEEMGVLSFLLRPEDFNERYGEAHRYAEKSTLTVLAHAFGELQKGALAIGVAGLALLVLWDRWLGKRVKFLPGSVVAVLLGVLLDELFHAAAPSFALSAEHRVGLPDFGSFAEFGAATTFPRLSALADPKLYFYAVALATVASLESLLSVEALDKLDPERRQTPSNKELIAQGAGNVVSGLLGGLPITAVVVRSTVNLSAGAKSKASTILHGVLLVTALLFLAPLINRIPLAALAAVLVHTGFKLASPRTFREMLGRGYTQWVPFLATVAAVVLINLLVGVMIGFVVATVFILQRSYAATRFELATYGRFKRLVLAREVTFLQKARLMETLDAIEPGSMVEVDGMDSSYVDPDILDVLEDYQKAAEHKDIQLLVSGIPRLQQESPRFQKLMSEEYEKLLRNNREWVKEKLAADPEFFKRKGTTQTPRFMFIGCSDSRVPENAITKTEPGEIFVHRNIANVVSLSDINLLSVLQYSVEVLDVKHLIVCGHYGCGGVRAALGRTSLGLIDNWISQIKHVVQSHEEELCPMKEDPEKYERRVVELHVIQQCQNLFKTSIVQNAIRKYGYPKVHGWVYDLQTGLIKDLNLELDLDRDFCEVFRYKVPPG